jgi:glutamyl-tRNA synthetase
MSYETAQPRLAKLGIEGEELWLLLRNNLARFDDVAQWAKLITGPVVPVIADEDRDFIDTARELLPSEPWSLDTWGQWTDALKAATGRKGKPLFLPLRMALTACLARLL